MSSVERPPGHRTEHARPIMTLALDSEGPATLITVCGEVDMSTAHLLTELAEHTIARRPARLVLDLAGVTFFSAHGISALLRTQHAATRAQVRLALRDPAPCVSYLLAATGTRLDVDGTTAIPITDRDGAHRAGGGCSAVAERGDAAAGTAPCAAHPATGVEG